MPEFPNLAKIKAETNKLNNGMAPRTDALGMQVYKYGGYHLYAMLTDVLRRIWQSEEVPPDWRGATMKVLYKTKSGKDGCNNYLSVSCC